MKKEISEKSKKKEINVKQRTKERKQWSKETSQGRTIKPKHLLNKKTLDGKKKETQKRETKERWLKNVRKVGTEKEKKKTEILIVWWSRQERKAITFGSEDKI